MKILRLLSIISLSLISATSFAEEAATTVEKTRVTSDELLLIICAVVVFGVAIIALMFCGYFVYVLADALVPSKSSKPAFSLSVWLNEKFGTGKLKPIEEEAEIALDHSYDGIVELDNGMPPWLRYVFTGTIVFAVIYVANYLVLDNGLNQLQEYEQELAIAEKQAETRKLLAANSIDESSVTLIKEAAGIDAGKQIYEQNCKACHGGAGEGGVGPNLTDSYWIHGGQINDIFKIVKYGVPEKGMISWQAKLKPDEIQKVSSYILSIQGTNPPNGKAPQGDLIEGESVTVLK